jgi:hypothetical protein
MRHQGAAARGAVDEGGALAAARAITEEAVTNRRGMGHKPDDATAIVAFV